MITSLQNSAETGHIHSYLFFPPVAGEHTSACLHDPGSWFSLSGLYMDSAREHVSASSFAYSCYSEQRPPTAHISALLSDVLVIRMAAAALPSDFTSGVPLFVTVYSPEYSGQPLWWDFLVDFSGSHQFLYNNFFLYISDISLRKCGSCSLHCDPVIVIKVNRQHCVSWPLECSPFWGRCNMYTGDSIPSSF